MRMTIDSYSGTETRRPGGLHQSAIVLAIIALLIGYEAVARFLYPPCAFTSLKRYRSQP